ncbi:MAG: hypothetical protein LKF54_00130 [Bacilli bacterium]|jgi:hypothetical protein|nr:hypothetical protein [Bacilli bacterium]
MSEKITLTEVRKDGTTVESISISREDLNIGVNALRELRRNNMGLVTYGQIKKLEAHIKRTGQTRYTKKELHDIIGETENAI